MTSWSLVAFPPSTARHPAMLAAVVDRLGECGVDVVAATYVAGSPLLFDLLYQGNRPTADIGTNPRLASAFLSVHEYDGPVAVALVAASVDEVNALKGPSAPGAARPDQLRGRFALTTHRASFLHVPDLPGPLADHLFGCGEHPLPPAVAGPDRSAELVDLAGRYAWAPTPTTAWDELRDLVLDRCGRHRRLLAAAGPCAACGRLPWRAELLDLVVGAVEASPSLDVTALASLELAQRDVVLAATADELQLVRAWLHTPAKVAR